MIDHMHGQDGPWPLVPEALRLSDLATYFRLGVYFLLLQFKIFIYTAEIIASRYITAKYLSMSYVIGVDGGTESLRASIFDLQGNQVAVCSAPYETKYPQSSWAEQEPSDWIQASSDNRMLTVCFQTNE